VTRVVLEEAIAHGRLVEFVYGNKRRYVIPLRIKHNGLLLGVEIPAWAVGQFGQRRGRTKTFKLSKIGFCSIVEHDRVG